MAAESIRHGRATEDRQGAVVVRARIGVHVGEAEERGGDSFGPAANVAAPISDAAHGGQVVASRLAADLGGGVVHRDPGFHVRGGVGDPVQIVQLCPGRFAELHTRGALRVVLPERGRHCRADATSSTWSAGRSPSSAW